MGAGCTPSKATTPQQLHGLAMDAQTHGLGSGQPCQHFPPAFLSSPGAGNEPAPAGDTAEEGNLQAEVLPDGNGAHRVKTPPAGLCSWCSLTLNLGETHPNYQQRKARRLRGRLLTSLTQSSGFDAVTGQGRSPDLQSLLHAATCTHGHRGLQAQSSAQGTATVSSSQPASGFSLP